MFSAIALPTFLHKNPLKTLSFAMLGVLILQNAHAAIEQPQLDTAAYVLMDYDTGTILAQKNVDQPYPPASLTKMMTSYIIEQRLLNGSLKEDTPITMTPNAWCKGNNEESCMYVPVNSTAPALDMLKGIIVQSGNDASKAMAEHLAGSEAAFSDLMNAEAKKLGMTHSHFVNATGMPAAGHEASAGDMAKLAQAIIKNSQKYYPIYSQKQFTYNNITQGNRNALLYTDPTIDGLKTGHTAEAGYCLVASSKRDNMRLISVIMGTKSPQARADQSRELLTWGFGHFATVIAAPAGKEMGNVVVNYGKQEQVPTVIKNNLQVLVPKIQQDNIQTQMDLAKDIAAPIKKGQELGKLIAVLDGKPVASVPIVAAQDVEESNIFARLIQYVTHFFKNLF